MKKLSLILSIIFLLGTFISFSQRKIDRKVVRTKNKKVVHTKVKNRNGRVVATKTTVKRRPHARYSHLPRRGVVVVKRPRGARVVRFNKRKYWLHNGVYYTRVGSGYKVIRPRRGLRIRILPVGYRRIVVKNRPYFYYYGTYYQRVEGNDEEYEVVDAPVEAQVDALPEGYTEEVQGDGSVHYVLDGVHYKEVPLDEDGNEWGYEVVKVEGIDDETNE